MNEQQAIEEIVKETCGACMGSDSNERHRCNECGYKKAIEALQEVESISEYLEPLRNYNTHNEHLEKLKELVKK